MDTKRRKTTSPAHATTQQKILTAARAIFLKHGFAGASIGKIATLADVNHSLVFHHFNNKQGLWVAVKQMIVDEAQHKAPTLPSTELDFQHFLAELVHNMFQFYRQNPDIIRMINWQRLETANNQKIGIGLSKESEKWLTALCHYQQAKQINSAIPVEFMMNFILSVVSSAALDKNLLIKPEQEKQYLEFCVDNLLKIAAG